MSKKETDFFWPSFTDLMTNLFFIMLVLYVLTFLALKFKTKATEDELKKIKNVQTAVKEMMQNTNLFLYDSTFKRYTLKRDIKFNGNKYDLSNPYESLNGDVEESINYIKSTGQVLKAIVDSLQIKKMTDVDYKDVSYILIITGSASDLQDVNFKRDPVAYTTYDNWGYILSYQRAKSLYDFWKSEDQDFDSEKYHNIIELVISGNGYGGVGRYNASKEDLNSLNMEERKNQRFLIQIVPKIGDVKYQ